MTVPALGTASGCKIYIGSSNVVHPDPTTDTYTEVGFISNMGEFGRVYSLIKFDDLSNRNTLKFKGQRDDGKMSLELGRSPSDAGQADMIVALDNDNDFNFKVTLNDSSETTGSEPTTFYFLAKVMSVPVSITTPNNVVKSKVDLELTSGSIEVVAAT